MKKCNIINKNDSDNSIRRCCCLCAYFTNNATIKQIFLSVMGFACLVQDECGQSGGEPDSDEDVITDYYIPTLEMLPRPGPLPTISVTPHSPASKIYPVLEDSLQQVRELHENVQQMRNFSIQKQQHNQQPNSYLKDIKNLGLNPLLAQVARLCTSCPTLNEVASNIDVLTGGCSLESSPLQQPPSMRKGSTTGMQDWLCQPETQRRRSWTALEDLTGNKEKLKHPNRQRSMSLSSMESEADESSLIDNVDGSTVRLLGPETPVIVRHRGTRSSGGAVSTHSLNEADLQNDFNKIKAKREAEQLRLLPQRLPLQKSISTPSIIAARDLASETVLGGAQPTLPLGRPSGTESETEEEGSRSSQVRYDHQSPLHMQYTSYDRHSEKRRKRGSLFFRKKKDKNKKNSHQWVSACYGTSQICDVCNKNLSNKPALYCENCGTSVHQHTCKDSIIECYKPKSYKTSTKISGFTVPLTSSKSSLSKRGSSSLGNSQISSSNRRNQLCYSPWRRVATKLGVNQIIYDEKDSDSYHGHHDSTSFPDDVPLVPLEFLSDSPLAATDLCTDLSLGLHENEPDSWTPYAGKDIARKLKEKEVKRQEHIYEFILTEKHHCITLLVMQKIFVEGLQKYFQMGPSWERMFPRLTDLTELHLNLLARLRQRQRENYIVESIADILLEQFSNEYSNKLKSAYGEFCSRHRDAVEMYKNYLQNDARFAQFVRHCQTNPLLKKKGIPECILFVTQRLTKYPLLIEPLIKTSKDNKYEQDILQKALAKVKEILIEVDAQVAEKEKEDRKLEIYNKIDPKSSTFHKEHKFKKSDILHGNRSLKFEGSAMLMQGRKEVLVIVLTDVIFFLLENSNKYPYIFYTPDNKAGVISLQKLLVREKAGQDNRGIYLISPNPDDPEMFELKVTKPKDRQIWIHAIREAVQTCPEDEEDSIALSSEEKQILLNAKQTQIRHIVGLLRQKDVEQALLLEEKMSLQLKLLSTAGLDPPSPPSYRHLVSENVDTSQMWKEVLTAVQEVSHLASSLYTTGTNLSRSVSSAGEHQSDTYVSPILPKRAETFGGFDNSNQGPFKLLGKKLNTPNSSGNGTPEMDNLKPGDSRLFERLPYRNCVITNGTVEQNQQLQQQQQQQLPTPDAPALLSLGREQQYAAIQLSHYVYTLLCIISQLMTTNESLQAQLQTLKAGESSKQYKHNQQLEELRNLQDKLSGEKTAWAASRDQESKELEEKRSELLRLQEQIRIEQNDIKQQRDQLYRKMEILTNQGLLISPNVALPVTGQLDENYGKDNTDDNCQLIDNNISTTTTTPTISASSTSSTSNTLSSTIERRKESKWNNKTPNQKAHLPINLISTTNQQKVSQVPIKQQIPLKLVSRLSSGTLTNTTITSSSSSSPSPSPSSQATLPGPAQMLPLKLVQDDKFRQKKFKPPSSSGLPIAGASSSSVSAAANNNNNNNNNNSNNTAGTNEEEVIYF